MKQIEQTRQAELRAAYRQGLCEVWKRRDGQPNEKMIDFCDKQAAHFVQFENGRIYAIEKPKIETSFCFGYGYCGVSSEEDYQSAERAADYATSNESYFLRENLKQVDDKIHSIESGDYKLYCRTAYRGETADNPVCSIEFSERTCYGWRRAYGNESEELTGKDIAEVLNGYKEVRKAFEKRLQTYLKRYGTSKLRSWAYLSD